MANFTIGNMKMTDGRLIRLSLVLFFGLVVLVYLWQAGDILSASSSTKFERPQMAVVPTVEAFEPDVDDVLIIQGDSARRTLDKGGIQNWTFSAAADTIVDLSVLTSAESEPNFNPVIELYAPSGSLLLKSDELGPNQPELMRGVTLPEAGEYTVWITDATFEHGATYTLTYTPYYIKATHPQRIGIGQTLRSTLAPNEFQMWVFSGAAEQDMSFTLLPIREHDDDFRPIGELYTPEGNLLARLDITDGINVLRNLTLPQTGNYTLWITDDGTDNSGEYALSVQQLGGKAEINERQR